MRMYDLRVEILAEDDRHAQQIMNRITELLSTEQMVLMVGDLEDITDTATNPGENELSEDEIEGQLRHRDIWFINQMRRLALT